MSTANGGSPNDTKLVADALSDTTLQVFASQIPALDEVAVAAADSFFVSACLQQLIAGIHVFCGFNWWASTIALQTVFIRLTVLPLAVTNLRSSSLMRPPLKWIFIQVPVFTSFFIAINNMAPWFVDSSHINSPPEEMWILAQEIKKASEGCVRPVVFLIYCVGLLQSLTGFEWTTTVVLATVLWKTVLIPFSVSWMKMDTMLSELSVLLSCEVINLFTHQGSRFSIFWLYSTVFDFFRLF